MAVAYLGGGIGVTWRLGVSWQLPETLTRQSWAHHPMAWLEYHDTRRQ